LWRPDRSSSPLPNSYFILMTVTTEYGKQNILAKETKARTPEEESYFITAERTNGQLAMIGFVALLGAYIFTGQIIPGVF